MANADVYYNYIYLDPRKRGQYSYDGMNFSLLYEPIYVGKGKGKRKYEHLFRLFEVSHKNAKIKKILNAGFDIKKFVLQINHSLGEKDSLETEQYLIYI